MATDSKTTAPVVFAFLCLLLGSAYIGAVTFLTFPVENKEIVNMCLVWVIGTMMSGSIGYVIGSSSSSAKKDKIIAEAKEAPAEKPAVLEKGE